MDYRFDLVRAIENCLDYSVRGRGVESRDIELGSFLRTAHLFDFATRF